MENTLATATKEKKFEEYIDVLKGDTLYIHADTGLEVGTALETSLTFKDEKGKELYVAEQEVYVEQSKSFNTIESAFHVPNIIKDNKIDETKVKTLHGALFVRKSAKSYDIHSVKYRPNIPFLKKSFWSKKATLNYIANGHHERTYAKGSKETEDVKLLQEALKKLGYDIGTFGPNKDGIDGDFGSTTEKNIKLFQKEYSQDHTKKPPKGITNVTLTQSKPSKYSYITLLPLDVNGVVNQQTLIAMDKALVAGWKHKEKVLKRAPWMDIALKEAKNYGGLKEGEEPLKSRILNSYYKYVNYKALKNDPTLDANAWCAAFASWVLGEAKYKNTKSVSTASFRKDTTHYKKVNKPIYGALVFWKNDNDSTKGHLAFVYGKTASGKLITLNGNQSDSIKFAERSATGDQKQTVTGFYVPKDYTVTEDDYLTDEDINSSHQLNATLLSKANNQVKKGDKTR